MSITFIVAARDEELRIARCLESLRAVVGSEDRVIVVDDGSVDATARVARSVDGLDVTVIRNESSVGRADARNEAVSHASTPLIAVQDADDFALPGRLEPARLLDERRDLVAASGQCLTRTAGGRWWRHASYPLDPVEIRDGLRAGVMTLCHTGSVMRRDAFVAAGGYDSSFPRAQDLDLFRRLAESGQMGNVADFVVVYQHDVVLPWAYWSQTRMLRRRMLGQAYSEASSRWAYPLAQGRRCLTFATTARGAATAAKAELGTA